MVKIARCVVFCLLVLAAITPAGAQAQESVACNNQEGVEICVTEFSIAKNVVTKGEDVTGVVTIENVGNTSGEVGIVVAISSPDNPTQYHHYTRSSISANQSKEVPLSFGTGDSSLGEHEMNVLLLDSEDDHMYDATGYSQATVVKGDSLTLGDVGQLIVTSSSALWIVVAVVLPLVGYFLGSHRFRQ